METENETKIATFNEAALQMTRLHDIQRAMNVYRINPFIKEHSPVEFNFQLWAAAIEGLFFEISPKLTKKEKEEVIKLLENSEAAINPLLRMIAVNRGRWTQLRQGQTNAYKVKQALREYEMRVRELLDEHGFGTQNKSDTSGDPYA